MPLLYQEFCTQKALSYLLLMLFPEQSQDLVLKKLLPSLVIKGADDLNLQGWSWSHKQESLSFLSHVWVLLLQRPNREGVCGLGACTWLCQ